ncbi:MAG: hypothetical protein ACLFTQ_00700 [Candidatus Aenigmatarchaeota archaeon]
MPPIDLHELIFEIFFELERCPAGVEPGDIGSWGCLTGEISHDFIFSLFLPHIILAVFIYLLYRGLGHKGLESLLGVGTYIFIVQMGWYGFFATYAIYWMLITMGLGFFFFIVGKIIPPAKTGGLFALGARIGKALQGKEEEED